MQGGAQMSRPKKATVDYFPHYVSHKKTMFTIENKYGNDGYAFWFKLLELLGSTEHHYFDCNNTEMWEYLLAKTRFSEENAKNILDLLSKLGAIDKELWEYKIIRSDNFIENLATVYKRRDIDVYTKEIVIGLCAQKLSLNNVSVNINPQSKVKKSKVKNKEIYTQIFEQAYKIYPRLQAKQDTFNNWNKLLDKNTEEELLQYVKNYLDYYNSMPDDEKGYAYSSNNFFGNKAYYLDFKQPKTWVGKAAVKNKPAQQGNFEQRTYSDDYYDKLYKNGGK